MLTTTAVATGVTTATGAELVVGTTGMTVDVATGVPEALMGVTVTCAYTAVAATRGARRVKNCILVVVVLGGVWLKERVVE